MGFSAWLAQNATVWLWDPKSSDEESYVRFLKRLGPIYRFGIRPVERVLRRVFHRLYGRRLQLLVAKINSGNIVGETFRDAVRIAYVGLATYMLVWLYYSW